jgi:DNA-binding NtrC family response regulator
LFYRLNVITIEVPSLRNRPGDIPLLAKHFAEQAAMRAERGRVTLTDAALAHLTSQQWPGNVRELENTIERAVILAAGDVLDVSDVAGPRQTPITSFATFSGDNVPTLDELERAHILKVLEICEGQKTKAAQMLGINRTTLWKKLRQYGLDAGE